MRTLRDTSLEGRLSMDTFSRRVETAYEARSSEELGELVRDLPPRSRAVRFLTRTVSACSTFVLRLQDAWRRPRVPGLSLPAGRALVTIGRSPRCDLVLSEATVSRRHAELRRRGDEWWLADLGSTNGTRLNGLRVIEPVQVHPGDRMAFGASRFRVGAL